MGDYVAIDTFCMLVDGVRQQFVNKYPFNLLINFSAFPVLLLLPQDCFSKSIDVVCLYNLLSAQIHEELPQRGQIKSC
jgi:hypothetical protein